MTNITRNKTDLADTLALHLRGLGVATPTREFKFDSQRRWRFDLCWPSLKLAAEVEGGTWTEGRHSRALGFAADCEKYNAAAILGYTVLRFTSQMVKNGEAARTVEKALSRVGNRLE